MATLTREEWGKSLEVVTAAPPDGELAAALAQAFPALAEARDDGAALKLEFRQPPVDLNPILAWLIGRDVRIREVKAGLEALYMKAVLAEEGRAS